MTQNFAPLLICNQQDFTDFSYCKVNRVIRVITLIKKNQQTKQIPSGERYAVCSDLTLVIRGVTPTYIDRKSTISSMFLGI